MLPAAPPGGASPASMPSAVSWRARPDRRTPSRDAPPLDDVLLALPPTAASASVLRSLRGDGIAASPASDGLAVLEAVRRGGPALVVFDVELPGPDQVGVLQAVQNEAPAVPVVAITPRERRTAFLNLLRGDRDDYLLRPFAVDELSARIRLRLRMGVAPDLGLIRVGELSVDPERAEVVADGRTVALSPTEFALLMALIATPGEVATPDRLARDVWREAASTNLVQVYISYLRRKIGPERIRTVRGAGYVLEA